MPEPSILERLMLNQRAAAEKKRPQQPCSSKKRKADSTASAEKCHSSGCAEPFNVASESAKPYPYSWKQSRPREKIGELRSKIGLLRKNPQDFDPQTLSCWDKGERVPFLFICLAYDLMEEEGSRNVITTVLCNMLRTIIATTPEDLLPAVHLSAAEFAPAHEGLELGIGKDAVIKALSGAFGRGEDYFRSEVGGDLGRKAKESRSSQSLLFKPEPLTVVKVFDTLRLVAKEAGPGSRKKKINLIKALIVAATDSEPQYVVRLLQGNLRTGFLVQTLSCALGFAAFYSIKHSNPPADVQSRLQEAAEIIKQAYAVVRDYGRIVPALLSHGVWNLQKICSFTLGSPIAPMLACPTKGVSQILNKFQDIVFTCEYKYDGERAQIHYMDDGLFEIYSRNGERSTEKFPDVVHPLSRLKKSSVKSFVLDCELVAYDREKKKILPFQILSTRARKNVNISDIKVDVCVFAFDMLYLNGEQLLQENLSIRREKLYNSFEEELGYFQFATAATPSDSEEMHKFLNAAVASGCEGLVIKTLNSDATYEPAKRSNSWLKLKKDYLVADAMLNFSPGDSLDLVPIAASYGEGKRTGVYGTFLLACYDAHNEEFQSICKIGTGFSDEELKARTSSLGCKVIPAPKPYYQVGNIPNPDVWFEPAEVWEVKSESLTESPGYCAAIGTVLPNKGISLRCPRYIRVREDKKPIDATSSDQIADMFRARAQDLQDRGKVDDA